MIPDFINGCFEAAGSVFILMHVRRVVIDKAVAGVSTVATVFFTLWGFWNLFYYPHLHQWWSFAGGLAIVAANATWVSLLIKYRQRRA